MQETEATTPGRGAHPLRVWVASIVLALILGLSSVSACGYRFGVDDQAQYLVQLMTLEQPSLFAGDPYVDAFAALGSWFWWGVALVTSDEHRAAGVLVIHVLVGVINAWLVMLAIGPVLPSALRGWTRIVATTIGAALLVVPKELNWFGLVSLSDTELTATVGVMPLLFASLALWTRGLPFVAGLPAFGALLVHGQTGAYLVSAWGAGLLILFLIDKTHRAKLPWLLVLALGCIGLVWGFDRAIGILDGVPPAQMDAYRSVGDGLYPELVHPLTAPLKSWGAVVALCGLGIISLWHLRRVRTPALDRLRVWLAAVLVFPCVGLIAHAFGLEHPLLWKLMVGRSLMLPQIGALLIVAIWSATLASGGSAIRAMLAIVLLVVWPLRESALPVNATLVSLAAVLLAIPSWRPDSRRASCPKRMAAYVSLPVLATVVFGVASFVSRPFPWLRSGEERSWFEVQAWARLNTPVDATFVTPPHRSGWRVNSHRATFGEVKDGCLLFYSGAACLDWAARMERLGLTAPYAFIEVRRVAGGKPRSRDVDAMKRVYQDHVEGVGVEQAVDYVVLERAYDLENIGDQVYANDAFIVRRR